jgi:hypothetical protein
MENVEQIEALRKNERGKIHFDPVKKRIHLYKTEKECAIIQPYDNRK